MQVFKPSVNFIENDFLFKSAFFFKNELPVIIMEKISKIPGIGSGSLKKTVEKGRLIVNRAWETGLLFDHFTNNSWIFETVQVEEIMKLMSKEE